MENQIQNKNKDSDYGKVFYQWSFSEFPQHQRSRNWYIRGSVVLGIILLYSIFTANFLFGLIAIIATLIVLMFQRSNNIVEFKITEDGILVDEKFYEYKALKNFFIIYNPPEVKTLYFEPKNIFIPRIPVPLEDQDPIAIRKTLIEFLEEDLTREDEPLSDQTSRFFKL